MGAVAPHVLAEAMREAIAEARLAASCGELPFGAVVVSADGVIVARTSDTVARTGDPTRHAEIDVVRLAVAARGGDLGGHALVSNVEPCAMCATAAWWARIGTIAHGLSIRRLKEMRPDAVEEAGPSAGDLARYFDRRYEIVSGVHADECEALWRLPSA